MTPTDQAALAYLIEFLKRNPQILKAAYGACATAGEMLDMQTEAEKPENWKMWGPRRPCVDDECDKNRIGVYDEGVTPNKWCEPTNSLARRNVAKMRYFSSVDPMSDMGFNLLELKTGEFRVGMLADCWPE